MFYQGHGHAMVTMPAFVRAFRELFPGHKAGGPDGLHGRGVHLHSKERAGAPMRRGRPARLSWPV